MIVLFDIVPKKFRLLKKKPKMFLEAYHYNLNNWLGKKISSENQRNHITLYKITVEVKKNRAIDWNKILYKLGTTSLKLILPNHLKFSELGEVPSHVSEYRNDLIQYLLFELASVESIKFLKKSNKKPRLFIIDKDGFFPELPLKYLPYVSEMTIFTENPECFLETKESALAEFGAIFCVTQSFTKLNNSEIVIAPRGLDNLETSVKNKVVFLAVTANPYKNNVTISNSVVVDGYNLKLSRWLSEQAPKGYDTEKFANVLIEIVLKTGFGRQHFKKILKPYEINLTGIENEKTCSIECQNFSRKQITYQRIRRMLESLDIEGSL